MAILITSAECDRGRVGIPVFRDLERALKRKGTAFRVVVKSRPLAARQYARLLGMPGSVIGDPSGMSLGRLNTDIVPSLVVLDRRGIVSLSLEPLPLREGAIDEVVSRINAAVSPLQPAVR